MPVECIATAAEQLRVALRTNADIPPLQTLGVDFETISLAQARKRGLGDESTQSFAQEQQHTLLAVARTWGGSPAAKSLHSKMVILSRIACCPSR